MNYSRRLRILALVIVPWALLVASGSIAWGATFSWVGPSNGMFDDAANWSPVGGPPGAADLASFDQNLVRNINFENNNTTTQSFRVTSGGESKGIFWFFRKVQCPLFRAGPPRGKCLKGHYEDAGILMFVCDEWELPQWW